MAAKKRIIPLVVGVVFMMLLFYKSTLENGGLVTKKFVPSIYLGIIDTAESKREELLRMLPQINTHGVDCSRIFLGDDEEIKKAQSITKVRTIPDRNFLTLARNCTSYRRRGYMTKPVSDEEERYPIAYVVHIYKDLVQIERLLMAIYRPQNWYCINVDLSTGEDVHIGMIAIASCFDNIVINNVDVAWGKMSLVEADLTCMQLLYNKNKNWKYLITLAGQMFPLKTNLDIVRILKSLNGSNAVAAITKRRDLDRWSHLPTPSIPVRLVKGGCHFAVTRGFVRYVLFDKRAHQFKKWTSKTHVPDEHYVQSLSHSPKLQAPGGYTGWPENGENGYEEIMRYVVWCVDGVQCHGKFVRCVCIIVDNTKGKEQNKSSKVNTPSRSKGTFAIKSEITEVKKPLSADGGSSTGPKTHSTEIKSLPQEIECQGVRKRLSMDTMGVQHMMDSSAIKVIHITELYQKRVTLEFFERLREERPGNSREDKFSSLQSGSQMVTMCSTFHLITEFGCPRNVQLHLFSDASEMDYGVIAYIRLEDDADRVHCSLVKGKSIVAPIKQQTILTLELAAATTAVRRNHQIQNILEPG
ncbi:hypothetical protein LSH36_175g05028 [Paralvinella palmiformis]|uniref:Uncharacterized protein n=1 Tax=Paralvinella palmiformis TaxID=53620 RepID=A0AAD9N5V1_9ANNE|nr:hypothetical protein LSH36_175g05028 [Paralvinella palmiformis]